MSILSVNAYTNKGNEYKKTKANKVIMTTVTAAASAVGAGAIIKGAKNLDIPPVSGKQKVLYVAAFALAGAVGGLLNGAVWDAVVNKVRKNKADKKAEAPKETEAVK